VRQPQPSPHHHLTPPLQQQQQQQQHLQLPTTLSFSPSMKSAPYQQTGAIMMEGIHNHKHNVIGNNVIKNHNTIPNSAMAHLHRMQSSQRLPTSPHQMHPSQHLQHQQTHQTANQQHLQVSEHLHSHYILSRHAVFAVVKFPITTDRDCEGFKIYTYLLSKIPDSTF
jgi:hypothetical protein